MEINQLLNKVKNYIGESALMLKFKDLFSFHAEKDFKLSDEDKICCKVTNISYMNIKDRPSKLDDRVLIDDMFNEEKHCAYINHVQKTIVIGYRGTDVMNMKDLMSDIQIVLGVATIDERVKESLMIYDAFREKYPDYKKWICGHSLGGTICYIVAKHRIPDRCTVFNPGSSLNQMFIQMLTNTIQGAPRVKNVYTYKILGDPVSLFSFVGFTKVFTVSSVDPVELHSFDNFLVAIDNLKS